MGGNSNDNAISESCIRVRAFDRVSGVPLPDAQVGVFLVQPRESRGEAMWPEAVLLQGRTDPDGLCILHTSLEEPMSIEAVVEARGHARWRTSGLDSRGSAPGESSPEQMLSPGGEQEIRADLEPGITLEGRVTDEAGEPVFGVHVGLVLSLPWGCSWPHSFMISPSVGWPPPCSTDDDGRFEWLCFPAQVATAVEESQFVLTLEHEQLAPAMVPSVEKLTPNDAGVIVVSAVLERAASIKGLVLEPSGEPACGATVETVAAPMAGQPVCVRFTKSTQTDEAGQFRLQGLGRSVQRITVELDGCAPTARELDLGADASEPLQIHLEQGTNLCGKILERDGQGLAQAVVFARSQDGSLQRRAVTDEDGGFRITGLPPTGQILLSCNPGIAETIQLPSQPITLRVPPLATLSAILVSAESGERLSGMVLVMGPGLSTHLASGPDLIYSKDGLPAGHYQLNANVEGLAPTAVELDLPATGLPEPFVIRVAPGFEATGTVTDSSGRGLPGVAVTAFGRSVLDKRTTESDQDGSWALLGLGCAVGIVLQADGWATRSQKIRFADDQTSEVVDLMMCIGASIRGRVVSGDGTPLERVHVTVSAGSPMPFPLPSALTDADGGFTLSHVPAAKWSVIAGNAEEVIKTEDGGSYDVELRVQ